MSDPGREAFEAWCLTTSPRCDLSKYAVGQRKGQYKNPVVQQHWKVWQARDPEVAELVEALRLLFDNVCRKWAEGHGIDSPDWYRIKDILAKHERKEGK